MRISEMRKALKRIEKDHGDIETTCLFSLSDDEPPFETTIENFEIHEHPTIGKCVKVLL